MPTCTGKVLAKFQAPFFMLINNFFRVIFFGALAVGLLFEVLFHMFAVGNRMNPLKSKDHQNAYEIKFRIVFCVIHCTINEAGFSVRSRKPQGKPEKRQQGKSQENHTKAMPAYQ